MAARRRAGDAIATKTCRTSVFALAVLLAALCDVSGAAAETPDMSCALGNEASLLRHFLDPEPIEGPTGVRRLSVEPATLIVPGATEAVIRFRDGDFFAKPEALQREILVFLRPVEDVAPVPFQPGQGHRLDIISVTPVEKRGATIGLDIAVATPPAGGWLFPEHHLLVAACSGDRLEAVGVARTRVSNATTAVWTAALTVLIVYSGIAYAVTRRRRQRAHGYPGQAPSGASDPVVSPWAIAAGISGRSSISNLQVLLFSLTVAGLLIHFLMLTGEISNISLSIAGLLGIVGAGTAAAHIVARTRDQIEPANLAWMRVRGWIRSDPSLSDLVTVDGEFAPTRFQSIVFSLVVLIGLLVKGSGSLESFEVPENILVLIGASQAIYIGGKFSRPSAGDEATQQRFAELNEKFNKVRALETELLGKIQPGAAGAAERRRAFMGLAKFEEYRREAIAAAGLATQLIGIEMPKKLAFGAPLIPGTDDKSLDDLAERVNAAAAKPEAERTEGDLEAALALAGRPYDADEGDPARRLAGFRARLMLGQREAARDYQERARAARDTAVLTGIAEAWIEDGATADADRAISDAASAAAEAPLRHLAQRLRETRRRTMTQSPPPDELRALARLAAGIAKAGLGRAVVPDFERELALSAGYLFHPANSDRTELQTIVAEAIDRLIAVQAEDTLAELRASLNARPEAPDTSLSSLSDDLLIRQKLGLTS